jgi:hypothetical protein
MCEAIHHGLDRIDIHLNYQSIFTTEQTTSVAASHLETVMTHFETIKESIDQDRSNATEIFLHYYVENIRPKVENDGLDLTDEARQIRSVIWIALMCRMVCWFLLHDFDKADVNIVPSDLMGSRMPIYIS